MAIFDEYMATVEGRAAPRGRKLVVVDVQPHDVGKHIKFDMAEFARFVNGFQEVLVLYNGDELGWETLDEMEAYYDDIGVELAWCDFVEKSYGFLRDWIDNGVDDDVTVRVANYMLKHGYSSSDELDESELAELDASEAAKGGAIYSDDSLARALEQFTGSRICGGAKTQCLREIELMMRAVGASFAEAPDFIYG